jgi:hypothetical protein
MSPEINLDLSKYKRFFAFGCSFTNYKWPTWADIIAREIPESYNYGRIGGGNHYIYQTIVEASIEYKFTKDDLIIVMFTNIAREDRYAEHRDGWITPGTLYYQHEYDKDFLIKFWCYRGYLMRDLALVHGVQTILSTFDSECHFLTMVPFVSKITDNDLATDPKTVAITDFYRDTLSKLKPSIFETTFNNNWNSRRRPKYFSLGDNGVFEDLHPTPDEYLEYLETIFPGITISEATKNYSQRQTEAVFQAMVVDQLLEAYTPQVVKSKHWPVK